MKKKGFTLVELLAVIAILAILVIIALPNVLGMFQSAKKNTFTTELQNIYKSATTQYVSDSMNRGAGQKAQGIWYTRSHVTGQAAVACGSVAKLDLSGTETIDYFIQFDLAGKVTKFTATDGEFVFWYDGTGLDIEKIGDKFSGHEYTVYTIADEAKKETEAGKSYYTIEISPMSGANTDGLCEPVSASPRAASKPTVVKRLGGTTGTTNETMTVGE